MIDYLKNIDLNLFFTINKFHSPFFDGIMFFVSSKWFWIPIILIVLFFSIKNFRKNFYIPILALLFCFFLTDRANSVSKKLTKRYRPSHNTEIQTQVHIVNGYRGGLYSFFSGHAANSLGLALLASMFFRKKWLTIFLVSWSVLVSYSRIYLGVHYPSDIIVGWICGALIAVLVYKISVKIFKSFWAVNM